MNQLQLIGNLGDDAQVQVYNDKKFVSFKIADTDKWTDAQGVTHEATTWVSCTMSGDGGNILKYLKKGVKVFVQGKMSTRVYSSPKERAMVAGINLQVFNIELCGGSSDDVPRQLVTPNGQIVDVFKFYFVNMQEAQIPAGTQLMPTRGNGLFVVNDNGSVTPMQQEESAPTESPKTDENGIQIF